MKKKSPEQQRREEYLGYAEIRKVLPVQARSGSGHLTDAVLILQKESSGWPKREENENRWILHIEGSPGQWYVSTLIEDAIKLGGPPGRLSIDMGQNWWVENYDEIFVAMLGAI